MDWIKLAQVVVQWLTLVNTVLNPKFPRKARKFTKEGNHFRGIFRYSNL